MIRDIYQQLMWKLWRQSNALIVPNAKVLGSTWESDVVKVLASGNWIEYEIKLTVSDYQADFRKCVNQWIAKCNPSKENNPLKHDYYQSSVSIKSMHYRDRLIPRPRQFYFVTPTGLLEGQTVPERYGILEFDGNWIRTKRHARPLQGSQKLSQEAIWNLMTKLSGRLCERQYKEACVSIQTLR